MCPACGPPRWMANSRQILLLGQVLEEIADAVLRLRDAQP